MLMVELVETPESSAIAGIPETPEIPESTNGSLPLFPGHAVALQPTTSEEYGAFRQPLRFPWGAFAVFAMHPRSTVGHTLAIHWPYTGHTLAIHIFVVIYQCYGCMGIHMVSGYQMATR